MILKCQILKGFSKAFKIFYFHEYNFDYVLLMIIT